MGGEVEMKLPDLSTMTDEEAIVWYTGEVARLMKKRELNTEYGWALLEWKKKMNTRLEKNRRKGWPENG